METWVWILIVVIALVILIALALLLSKRRERVHEERRASADELRVEADRQLHEAGRRRAVVRLEEEEAAEQRAEAERLKEEADARERRAREQARMVDRERQQAEDLARRADEIDPDAPNPGDDFDAEEAVRRRRSDPRPAEAGEEHPPSGSGRDDVNYSWEDDESGDEGRRPGSRRAP